MLREITPNEVMQKAMTTHIWVLKRYDTSEHHGYDFIDLDVFGTLHEIKNAVESGAYIFMIEDGATPAQVVKNAMLR